MYDEIAEEVERKYAGAMAQYGLRKVGQKSVPEAFGYSRVDLENKDLRIRVERDRGEIFVNIGVPSEPDTWWYLTDVLGLVGKWEDPPQSVVPAHPTFDQRLKQPFMVDLFLSNYATILEMFSPDRIRATTEAITQMQDERTAAHLAELAKRRATSGP